MSSETRNEKRKKKERKKEITFSERRFTVQVDRINGGHLLEEDTDRAFIFCKRKGEKKTRKRKIIVKASQKVELNYQTD
jgi:hypothetical protein